MRLKSKVRGRRSDVRGRCSWIGSLAVLVLLVGCVSQEGNVERQQRRNSEAKECFDRTVKMYHLPSAEAQGAVRDRLLQQAASGYERLLRDFRDQPAWCAQALRSLGNVRATQGRLDQATTCYEQVGEKYVCYDWEVMQAWKSAADLLWEAGRKVEARQFYVKMVVRFDNADVTPVMATIVRAAKAKIQTLSP